MSDDPTGTIVAVVIIVPIVACLIIWYMYRVRFWYRTAKVLACFSCCCGWLCCGWKHVVRKPPHTGLCAGSGRKSRAKRVAICFPHNPCFHCCPEGCHCDPCCDDSPEARSRRIHMDPEAHPFGLGCACPCAPLCLIRCLCEDDVEEGLASNPAPPVPRQQQQQPARPPVAAMARPASNDPPSNNRYAGPAAAAPPPLNDPPPAYDDIVQDDADVRKPAAFGAPAPLDRRQEPADDSKEADITATQAAKVLAKKAAQGVAGLASGAMAMAKSARSGSPAAAPSRKT
ncbi:unnamed protein product (mitochondrion) [Plasmodiophora brassicae]|uniref:Uncharacterized protein n=1 Tax=Plasmodiophora brassicae TaxID=37360 RepID=A0A3P3YC17_PLABS|nr:unnamed protein product [Plasmodiophora brassicae]